MTRSRVVAAVCAVIVIVLALASYLVVTAIGHYGAANVQAFAGVMSFVAVVVAAIATVVYVMKTADIAQAASASAEQQARVADLMEKDLRFRIAPFLRYVPQAGDTNRPSGLVLNTGRGVAVDLQASFHILPGGRKGTLEVPMLLEPEREAPVRFVRNPGEGQYAVLLRCTDSVGFNEYTFEWSESGAQTGVTIWPRSRN